MNLYLVRHAQPKAKEEDSQRSLSDQGRADIRKVAAHLGDRGIEVSRILHSSKLRARQTAEALSERLHPSGDTSETDGLAPLDDPTVWSGRLAEIQENIMLVGHLPHLGLLADLLLAGETDQQGVSFKPGGVVCLKRDEEGRWSLRWTVVPEILQ
ncbi:MAG: phosphohistidine phosphatase SixA [Fidelibacterota bacterium]|nr:MAG: phosphohistidine phosphatase SixA [Candidatus Neomarinimicrobiota bacterium]